MNLRDVSAKCTKNANGCWIWDGATNADGYGVVRNPDPTYVHKLTYQLATGSRAPTTAVLDHTCRNRACCNPAHLVPVSRKQNTLKEGSKAPTAVNAAKTRCHNGHPLTGENLWINPKTKARQCKACIAQRKRHERS